jgi:hypothetical protein
MKILEQEDWHTKIPTYKYAGNEIEWTYLQEADEPLYALVLEMEGLVYLECDVENP